MYICINYRIWVLTIPCGDHPSFLSIDIGNDWLLGTNSKLLSNPVLALDSLGAVSIWS